MRSGMVCGRWTTFKARRIELKKSVKQEKLLWKKAAWDMLYLTKCGIHSVVPEKESVEKMDLRKVFILSQRQNLEAITYMALESLLKINDSMKSKDSEQILKRWEESKNKAIRKTMLMDAERSKLFAYLEAHKIWHLPLKGIILSSMYPKFGMRQMSDNDILFDKSYRKEVHDWFVEQGYVVKSFEESVHDEYQKKPVYYFEMHTELFHEKTPVPFQIYYSKLKEKLKPKKGKMFELEMSDEDFYIYMLAHTYKHYSQAGTGLRSLLDVYIYNSAKPQMNWKYLDEELTKLELLDFEKEIRNVSMKIFSQNSVYNSYSEKEKDFLHKFLFGAVYGTLENVWKKRVQDSKPNIDKITIMVKTKYLFRRIVPTKIEMEKWCKDHSPFFLENRWLLPAAYIWRIVRADRKKINQFKKEVDTVRKM